jgi:ribosome recycling factor
MTNNSEADSLAIKVQLAFEDASHRVIERARAANTKVVIWRDGAIVRLTPDEAEQELAANLAKQATSQN